MGCANNFSRLFFVIIFAQCCTLVLNEMTFSFEDSLQVSSERIVQDLIQNYNEELRQGLFFETFSGETGDEHRELVEIKSIEEKSVTGQYLQWRHERVGLQHHVFGLRAGFLDVYGSDLQKKSSIGISESAVAMTSFTRWNDVKSHPEIVIVVVTEKPSILLYTYENEIRQIDGEWPLHSPMRSVEAIYAEQLNQIMLIPKVKDEPVDIYNIDVNSDNAQVWYHQRLDSQTTNVIAYETGRDTFIAAADKKSIEIYRFDINAGKYINFKNIAISSESRKLVAFTLHYHQLLASLPESGESVEFFRFDGSEFRPEVLGSIEAYDLKVVELESLRDEGILITRSKNGDLNFHSYSNSIQQKGFFPQGKCDLDPCTFDGDLSDGVSFTINGQAVYFMPSETAGRSSRVLSILGNVQEVLSPQFHDSSRLHAGLEHLANKFLRWEKAVTFGKSTLADALSLTQSNIVTGHWSIGQLSASEVEITTNHANATEKSSLNAKHAFNDFTFVGSRWEDEDFQLQLSETNLKLQKLKRHAEEIWATLGDAVPINSDEVHKITAKQTISSSISCKSLESVHIQVKSVNRQNNVAIFLANIVPKTSSITISSVNFNGVLHVNHLQTGTLFDIPVENIAVLSEKNDFKCPIQFQSPLKVLGSVHSSTVNGLNFKEEVVHVNDVKGVKLTNGLVASKRAEISGPVDSINIQKAVFENIFLRSTAQKVKAPFFFTDAHMQSAQIEEINGENFVALTSHIVSPNFVGTIFGRKTVLGEVECSSMFIAKTLNEMAFPDDFIFANQKKITLSGSKSFSSLIASKVTVSGEISGINTADLVLRDKFASLKKSWTFAGSVKFVGDVTLRGTINGISTDQLQHHDTLDMQKSSFEPNADVEFLQPVVIKALDIESRVNGKSFEELFDTILLFRWRQPVEIEGLTTFRKSLKARSLTLDPAKINQVNLDNFFTTSSPQTITGNMVLQSGVKFSKLYALAEFDSLNLAQLFDDAFLLSKARVLTSDFSFEHVSCGSAMKVMQEINDFGTDFASAVAVTTGRKEQVFAIATDFETIQANTFKIGLFNHESGRTLAGLDIEAWFDSYTRLSENVRISHAVEVLGNVKALDGIEASKINGLTISHLRTGVLRTDVENQKFTGAIKTSGLVQVNDGEIQFDGKVSGYDLDSLFLTAFPLNSVHEEVIHSSWAFEKITVKKGLEVDGMIGGVNLGLLDADIVRKGDSFIAVHGKKSFALDLEVRRTLHASMVNFADLFSNVFTLHTEQTITGAIEFTQDQVIKETLRTTGSINTISLDELAETYSFDKDTKSHILKHNVESEGFLSSDNLDVGKLIQNQKLHEFLEEKVVRLTQSGLKIDAHKTFSNVVKLNGRLIAETVNDYAVSQEKRIARKTDERLSFKHKVKFLQEVEVPQVTVLKGDVVFKEMVHTDFDKLVSEAVHLTSTEALGNISFESIVVLANIDKVQTLNDIRISDIATTHSTQNLGNLNVKSVILNGGDVVIKGKVIGHDLKDVFQNTFMSHSVKEQFNQGSLNFNGRVIVKGNFRCLGSTIDDIVTTNSEHEIKSPIEFEHRIHVKHLQANNLVNGHRIEEIASQALTKEANEDITGFWKFERGVTFKANVEGSGHIDGHHIPQLITEKKTEAVETQKLVQVAQSRFEAKCGALTRLSTVLATSPCRLHSIDTHQSILTTRTVHKMATVRNPTTLLLFAVDEFGDVSTYRWNTITEQFVTHQEKVKLGSVQALRSVSFESSSILVYMSQESRGSASHGLKVVVFRENGEFSPSTLVASATFKDIQLIQHSNSEDVRTTLFALDDEGKVFVFEWDTTENRFSEIASHQLKGPVTSIAVANYLEGIALLHHCDTSVHLSHFSFKEKSFKSWDEYHFLTNSNSVPTLFEEDGKLFGLVEGKDSATQPACNLQVLQLHSGINIIQKMRASNPNSVVPFKYCGINYIASFSKSVGVTVYKFQGLSGFTVFNENPIKVANGLDMTLFTEFIKDYGSNVPFIAVSTSRSIEIFHSNVIGHQFTGIKSHCKG